MAGTTIRITTGNFRGICFQTLTGGLGALFFDSLDQVVWAYFKTADNDTTEDITTQLAEMRVVSVLYSLFFKESSQDRTFEVYFGDAGIQVLQVRQAELQQA